MSNSTHQITELLEAWSNGDMEALDRLIPLVDRELKKIARRYMRRENPEHILQPTALVNEALIKLIRDNLNYENRKHFYFFVAKRMRQVLIDYANRTPRVEYVDVDEAAVAIEKSEEMLRLEQALNRLSEFDERKAQIVECRFFIGLTVAETAELLGVGESTVERDWKFTRSWLLQQITGKSKES
ncbi:MAG TPA: ECF-type sigma factor [Pyrinomonadaceae bacterium]|nr:ECF-type sigma factor [Pyrinomonadaceae bacterium]